MIQQQVWYTIILCLNFKFYRVLLSEMLGSENPPHPQKRKVKVGRFGPPNEKLADLDTLILTG